MTKTAISTIYQHPKGDTLYITVAAKLASDSAFPFKGGDKVRVTVDSNKLVITKI